MTSFAHPSSRRLCPVLLALPLMAGLTSCTSDSVGAVGQGGSSGARAGGGSGTSNASGGLTGAGGTGTVGLIGVGGTLGAGGLVGAGGTLGAGGMSSTGGQEGVDAAADGAMDVPLTTDAREAATLCTSTGGQLETGLCCASVGDFPNSCLGGACGCAPDSSHTVVRCICPANSCFSPDIGCAAIGMDAAVGAGGNSGSGGKGGAGGAVATGGSAGTGGNTGTGGVSGTGGDTGVGGTTGAGGSSGDGGTVDVQVSPDAQELAALCTSSGGQISSGMCCTSIDDFPDGCVTGACGCSPTSSHSVALCSCPSGKCFSRTIGCASN
jgi:hypothetical protein